MKSFIQNWLKKNLVLENCMQSFWEYLNNYKKEEPNEYNEYFNDIDLDKITLLRNKVSYNVNFIGDDFYDNITMLFRILYNDLEIGYYRIEYDLDGTETDDILKIY